MLLTIGDGEPLIGTTSLLEEFFIHLEECGSQTNLQHYHHGSGLQGRPFHQSVIIMEFIADGLQSFIDWHIREEVDNVKTNANI
jgi:hypothetical protein